MRSALQEQHELRVIRMLPWRRVMRKPSFAGSTVVTARSKMARLRFDAAAARVTTVALQWQDCKNSPPTRMAERGAEEC